MTEILIQELRNSDINWLIEQGRQQRIAANTVLFQQSSNVNTLYIVLEGTLSATVKRNPESALASAFAALEDDSDLEQEIDRFSSGDVLGEISFLNISPSAMTVKAKEHSVVLALPRRKLLARLQQDPDFASRFYRAIAILLLDRFERLLKKYTGRQNLKIPILQDVPLLFAALSDSDIDWIIQHNHVEKIPLGTTLIQAGRPVDTLYLLLQGSVSVWFQDDPGNSLAQVFALFEDETHGGESPGYEIAQATRGELLGDMALIHVGLSAYTFKALEDLQVLAIKKQQLSIKLQQNPSMGDRVYKAIAMLLSIRLQGLISRLGYGPSLYRAGQTLSPNSEYSDEITLDVMDNLTLGGARFHWMLGRVKVLSP